MRAQSWILIVIALGCGLVASIGISQVMDRGESSDAPEMEMEGIFIAIVDIPTGDPITPQMIKLEKWPKDKLPEGVITQLENVEKRRPRSAIIKGEPILEGKLIGPNEKGAIEQLTPGFQAVAIKVTAEDISGGLVKPGDRVNVLVYLQKGDEIPATGIMTLLRNVRVFAIDSAVEREEQEGKTIQAKTVTLELVEKDAAKVTLAQAKGRIRLTLRRPGDTDKADKSDGEFVNIDELMGTTSKQPEAPKPADVGPTNPPVADKGVNANELMSTLMNGQLGSVAAGPAKEAVRIKIVLPTGTEIWEFPEHGEPFQVSGGAGGTTSGSTTLPGTVLRGTNDKTTPAALLDDPTGESIPGHNPEN